MDMRKAAPLIVAAVLAGCGGGGSNGKDSSSSYKLPAPKAGTYGVGDAVITTNTKPGEVLPAEKPDTGFLKKLPQPSGVSSGSAACATASSAPSGGNLGSVSQSVLCLLNSQRTARGLHPLKMNRKLSRAALAHAKNMVERHYFSHNGPDGTPLSRIKKAGYIPRVGLWTVGENLAWGTGTSAAAGQIMTAWMNSPEHKANILTKGFKEIGIGIVASPPSGGGPGATYATTFGGIRRH